MRHCYVFFSLLMLLSGCAEEQSPVQPASNPITGVKTENMLSAQAIVNAHDKTIRIISPTVVNRKKIVLSFSLSEGVSLISPAENPATLDFTTSHVIEIRNGNRDESYEISLIDRAFIRSVTCVDDPEALVNIDHEKKYITLSFTKNIDLSHVLLDFKLCDYTTIEDDKQNAAFDLTSAVKIKVRNESGDAEYTLSAENGYLVKNARIAGHDGRTARYNVAIDQNKQEICFEVDYLLNPKKVELEFELLPDARFSAEPPVTFDLTKDTEIFVESEDETSSYRIKALFPTYDSQPVSGYRKDIISNLMLIYNGADGRPGWDTQSLIPYVVHTFSDGKKEWMYDGFLFFDVNTEDGGYMFAPYSGKYNARKQEWQWFIDRQLNPGCAIHSLEKCVSEQAKELGAPPFRHQVVIGLPTPMRGQKDWGDGLVFNSLADRVKACCWFIDNVIERFGKEQYYNLELAGFYWIDESVFDEDIPLTAAVGAYIREQHKRFYWIPYYTSWGYDKWKEAGFDIAYHQPNYFFNANVTASRLDQTCQLAKQYNMGLEVEFDAWAKASHQPTYRKRLIEYLEKFESLGALNNSSLAYYEGGGALLLLSRSSDPLDKELLDRLSAVVSNRIRNKYGILK